jgi:hypothetical protein
LSLAKTSADAQINGITEDNMKYVAIVLAVAVSLFPASAFAACPDQNGPFSCCGGYTWYTFTFDTSCASTSGSVSATTLSCFSMPAYSWDYGSGTADYSMSVPYGMGGSNWTATVFVDFNDPYTYNLNAVSASVYVWHNGNLSSNQTFFIHQGNQGSLSCQRFDSSAFSVIAGDTIEVIMTGQSYNYGTTMKISTPIVFSN